MILTSKRSAADHTLDWVYNYTISGVWRFVHGLQLEIKMFFHLPLHEGWQKYPGSAVAGLSESLPWMRCSWDRWQSRESKTCQVDWDLVQSTKGRLEGSFKKLVKGQRKTRAVNSQLQKHSLSFLPEPGTKKNHHPTRVTFGTLKRLNSLAISRWLV